MKRGRENGRIILFISLIIIRMAEVIRVAKLLLRRWNRIKKGFFRPYPGQVWSEFTLRWHIAIFRAIQRHVQGFVWRIEKKHSNWLFTGWVGIFSKGTEILLLDFRESSRPGRLSLERITWKPQRKLISHLTPRHVRSASWKSPRILLKFTWVCTPLRCFDHINFHIPNGRLILFWKILFKARPYNLRGWKTLLLPLKWIDKIVWADARI